MTYVTWRILLNFTGILSVSFYNMGRKKEDFGEQLREPMRSWV
jgi:hypothetical protein